MTTAGHEKKQTNLNDSERRVPREPPELAHNEPDSPDRDAALREDQRQKLDRLVRANLPRMLQLAQRLTGDLDMAEEVMAEAMFRAARGWDKFRDDADATTWLYRIVVNTFRSHVQRASREQPISEQPFDKQQTPEQSASNEELARIVAGAVSRLPTRQREVLVLTTYENLSVDQIGKILEMSDSNVYTTLHHARQRLKKDLHPFISIDRTDD